MMLTLASLFVATQLAAAAPPPLAPADTVDVVVYSDFQCPYCAVFSQAFRELQTKGVDGVKTTFRFKNFPLQMHAKAQLAHQAAVAAGEQGRFWEMHDLLFANQRRAERDDLVGYAKTIGLDLDRFLQDLDSEKVRRLIDADKADGATRHISGTPTFYVNGTEYVGTKAVAELTHIVQSESWRSTALAEIGDDLLSAGPAGAPVTIEFFADLQSPVSLPALTVLNEIRARFASDVRLQFRNFPLAFHPQAALAHEAAMTAARGGRFWEFATFVMNHQDALREQDLIALAGRLGLDAAAFAQTIKAHRYAPRVQADVLAGSNKGIRGSPVILVNGKRIDGVPSLQTLTAFVEAALAAQHVNQVQR